MKKLDTTPKKARVKGNILADWETLLTKSKWEDYNVKREKINNVTWNKKSLTAIRLNPIRIPVLMRLYVDQPSINPGENTVAIVRLQYSDAGRETLLEGQTVYLYEGNTLLATGVTAVDGTVYFDYTSEKEGTHTITARSASGNGYDAAEQSTNVYVMYRTHMTLEPKLVNVGFGEVQQLTATLYDGSNNRVPDKPIEFYEGSRPLGTITTDKNGRAICRYLESDNRGATTQIIVPTQPVLREHQTSKITGSLTTWDGLPVEGEVKLFEEGNAQQLAHAISNEDGNFTINYIPRDNETRHYYLVFMSTIEDPENNEYLFFEPSMYDLGNLTVHKALPDVIGVNASAIKGDTAGWQCIVPKDYTGYIYVYATDANGKLLSTDGNSILSSTKLFTDDVTTEAYDSKNVLVTWHGWDDSRTYAQSYQNKVGQFYIRYRLYDDKKYENTYSDVKHINIRQQAVVTMNNEVRRKLDTKEISINGTCKDELGNNYNGQLDVVINNKLKDTVECVNGVFNYSLMPDKRRFTDAKVSEVEVKFTFANSGYWAALNDTGVTKVLNVKNNQTGFYMPTAMSWETTGNSLSRAVNTLGFEDLYIVTPQEQDFTKLEYTINKLADLGVRNKVTVHAVVPCYTADSHYKNNRLDLTTRLNNLKNHITQLLTMDIDGICLQDIRGKVSNANNKLDVASALTTLVDHITSTNYNVMISAIVDCEVANSDVHGQDYSVFCKQCDYIMPYMDATGKGNEAQGTTWSHAYTNIDYYQNCLELIHEVSQSDNVYPLVVMSDANHGPDQGYMPNERRRYIIRGVWNYGVSRGHVQKSFIHAQHFTTRIQAASRGLNCNILLDEDNPDNMITTAAIMQSIQEASGDVYVKGNPLVLTLRTGYGGKAGYNSNNLVSLAMDGISITRKSDGATEFPLDTVTEAKIDLTKFNLPASSGQRTLELTIGESKAMRIKEVRATWQYKFK